jgi:gliding motility-associated-like protein
LAPNSVIGPQSFAVLNTIVDVGASTSILDTGDYVLVAHYADAASFGINYLGCDAKKEFEILGPSAIQENSTVNGVSCWGENTGSISLIPFGGTPPYSFAWDTTVSLPPLASLGDTLGSINAAVNNLLAGTYTVTITDDAGCEITRAIIVTQPDQLQNNFTIIDVQCNGDESGKIISNLIGGTPPYSPQLVIDLSNGATVLDPNQLSIGDYSVTIKDDNNCFVTDTFTVGQPNALTLSLEPTYDKGVDLLTGDSYAISCYGANDGVVLAVVAGGIAPYQYNWSSGSSTNPAIAIAAGTLTLNLEDDNGCLLAETIALIEPDAIDPDAVRSSYGNAGNQVSCLGASDGSIELNTIGGVPFSNGLYSYTWTSPNGFSSTSKDIYDLEIGDYSVDIEDANGCIYSFNYTLISPSEAFSATVSTLNYAGPAHPPVNVTFSDSTTDDFGNPIEVNHYWYWSIDRDSVSFLNSGFDTFNHEFKEVGQNLVYVVVENASTGCKDDTSFIIQVQGIDFITNVFSPNGDGKNDEFVFDETGIKVVSVEIYNRWGSLVMNWTGLDKTWDGTGPDGQKLPEAVYFYVLSGEGEDGYYYENKGTITLRR